MTVITTMMIVVTSVTIIVVVSRSVIIHMKRSSTVRSTASCRSIAYTVYVTSIEFGRWEFNSTKKHRFVDMFRLWHFIVHTYVKD